MYKLLCTLYSQTQSSSLLHSYELTNYIQLILQELIGTVQCQSNALDTGLKHNKGNCLFFVK